MDYEQIQKRVADYFDSMTDEELNADFRRFCGITPEDELPDFPEIQAFDFGVSPCNNIPTFSVINTEVA